MSAGDEVSDATERSEPVARPLQQATLVAVIELSKSNWLIAGTVPGIERQPLKKIVLDETELLRVLHRWRGEAVRKDNGTTRTAVAFEAGRGGFWLARWLAGHGIVACMTMALLVCSGSAKAVNVDIRGKGASQSCGSWTADRKTRENWLPGGNWILGFVSGAASGANVNLIGRLDSDGLLAWVDNYCRQQPPDLIAQAATRLVEHLASRQKQQP